MSRRWLRRPELSAECLIGLFSVLATVALNYQFWAVAFAHRDPYSLRGAGFIISTGLCIAALHGVLFGLLGGRRMLRPMLGLVWLLGAFAACFMQRYTVYLDADMLRNVLHTQPKEARELLTAGTLLSVLAVSLPVWLLLGALRLTARSLRQALLRRSAWLLGCATLALLAALAGYRDLAPLLRTQHAARYLVTRANLIVATLTVLRDDLRQARRARQPIGLDAHRLRAAGGRPRVLVLVIGETVRARNWGLNGYIRDTTPELARWNLINYPDVSACGSNTEVSLPCMLAPVGRRDYDEGRIRGQQSLLHVFDHAGIDTLWLDNQTGCKGTCEGLGFESIRGDEDPAACDAAVCLDQVLFARAMAEIDTLGADVNDQVIVVHPLGNHGPAYSRRYPPAFARFTPACESADLDGCDAESIRNSYDNAILYTDHLLSQLAAKLAHRDDLDTALVYVSDHGESLGEHGLYLHGLPYPLAPDEQLKVPMMIWLSDGLESALQLQRDCLIGRSQRPYSHDNLFHSLLGLMDVHSALYDPGLDLFQACRPGPRAAGHDGIKA